MRNCDRDRDFVSSLSPRQVLVFNTIGRPMNKNISFVLIAFATTLLGAMVLFTTPSCTPEPTGCNSDVDCGGLKCQLVTGLCVECLEPSDCEGDGGFCCKGTCLADTEIESNCGCSLDAAGTGGVECGGDTPVCQLGNERVSLATVDEGTCGCPCDATQGGTICELSEEAEAGFVCGCNTADPTTCSAPTVDDTNVPHMAADICGPDGTCACFGEEGRAICGAGTPDCTPEGCANLTNAVDNCGSAGRFCADEDNGIGVDGTCIAGGCECNAPSDCQAEGLNVDSCAFLPDNRQACVCDGYEIDGNEAACPMGLPCVEGGCELDGVVYGTDVDLLNAIAGIEPAAEDEAAAQ